MMTWINKVSLEDLEKILEKQALQLSHEVEPPVYNGIDSAKVRKIQRYYLNGEVIEVITEIYSRKGKTITTEFFFEKEELISVKSL